MGDGKTALYNLAYLNRLTMRIPKIPIFLKSELELDHFWPKMSKTYPNNKKFFGFGKIRKFFFHLLGYQVGHNILKGQLTTLKTGRDIAIFQKKAQISENPQNLRFFGKWAPSCPTVGPGAKTP